MEPSRIPPEPGERDATRGSRRWLTGRGSIALLGFLGIAGYFLWTEHQAHFIVALPWLLLLACPLMHLFMHHGHDGRHEHTRNAGPDDASNDGAAR